MFAIIFIYIMLLSFIVIIVTALCYLAYMDWRAKRFDERVNKIHSEFCRLVLLDLDGIENNKEVDFNRINYIKSKLKKNAYEKVFQNSVILYGKHRPKKIISSYMVLYEEYLLKKTQTIKPNGSINHVQNIFMFGEYRHNHPLIIKYLLKSIESQSMFTRFNSMSAIAKIGHADALVDALIIVSNQRYFMNTKVLTDVIDNFEGDKTKLDLRLVSVFRHVSKDLRLLIISYFNNERSSEPKEIFAKSLLEVTDKEEYIRLLKYFSVIYNPKSLPKIIESLKNDSWEIRAIASKSLINYTVDFDLNDVISSLGDENWYVRTNTGSSILKHLIEVRLYTEENIDEFMSKLVDKYAIGALNYARHLQ